MHWVRLQVNQCPAVDTFSLEEKSGRSRAHTEVIPPVPYFHSSARFRTVMFKNRQQTYLS